MAPLARRLTALSRHPRKTRMNRIIYQFVANNSGGERGIRTLDNGLSRYNALAGRPLRPLGHLSGWRRFYP